MNNRQNIAFFDEGGLRKKGHFKTTQPDKPLVSVVTVVLNSHQHIEQTIQSVINQTYDNVEYIIVDGGSTDGTLDIIKGYGSNIDYWISRPDKGIYHAMNLGIELVRGDWVNFMNSEDRFFNNNIIKEIFNDDRIDADVIYGNTEIRYQDFKRIKKVRDLTEFRKGMPFCHQSSFCKTSILQNRRFDTAYQNSADFDFFYKTYVFKKTFLYYEGIISSITASGLTDRNRILAIKENWRCVRNSSHHFYMHLYYICRIVTCTLKEILKRMLGKRFTSHFKKMKYGLNRNEKY